MESPQITRNKGFKIKQTPDSPPSTSVKSSRIPVDSKNILDRLGDLPRSTGENSIFLVAQDPHCLFTYWDFDISQHPNGPLHLRYYHVTDGLEGEIQVMFETRHCYIPVKHAGAEYYIDLGFYRGRNWTSLARSTSVKTPSDQLSSDESFTCATVPLQIEFQRLLKSLRQSFGEGENLIEALGRLQREAVANPESAWKDQNRQEFWSRLIESLLGREVWEQIQSGVPGSEEIGRLMEGKLREHFGSESSFQLAQEQQTRASGLFSTASGYAAFSGWVIAALSSFAAAGAQSSWKTTENGLRSQINLSSWMQSTFPTSWGGAASPERTQAALTRLVQSMLTSWSGSSAGAS